MSSIIGCPANDLRLPCPLALYPCSESIEGRPGEAVNKSRRWILSDVDGVWEWTRAGEKDSLDPKGDKAGRAKLV